MQLYNTLTKSVQPFSPIQDNTARIYSCGPTVYDSIHIGNLSAFVYADTLRRVLKASDMQVRHVMNFTDVDDKTIRRSREQDPGSDPLKALKTITEKYAQIFLEDMEAIGNDVNVYEFIKATDYVPQMQLLIKELLNSGIAYKTDDGIYFSITTYRERGKTYGQLLTLTVENTSEARIQNDEYDKATTHDFALWKKQKDGEPAWNFEIEGESFKGRPGWHIECSAMSKTTLGLPFDIH
ncbi:MAG: cysteine--tRNA ligase, partial [bacterium]|nr:cysteine--tRNA ligase [bacterium]